MFAVLTIDRPAAQCSDYFSLFVASCSVASVVSNHMDHSPPGSSVHGILQANTGVGCYSLLQGIFLAQELNLYLFIHYSQHNYELGIFYL